MFEMCRGASGLIIAVEEQPDYIKQLSNMFAVMGLLYAGLGIIYTINEITKEIPPPTLSDRLEMIESKIITKHIQLNDEVIIP